MIEPSSIRFFQPEESKVHLITGASGRVGSAIAKALCRPGDKVILQYHSASTPAEKLAAACRTAGAEAWVVGLDMLKSSAAEELVGRVNERHGRVDHFIHAAMPTIPSEHLLEWNEKAFMEQMEVQIASFLRLCLAVLPSMQQRQEGVIMPLLSTVTDAARPKKWCSYTIAKFALMGATLGLSTDIMETGVRIVGLMLGKVASHEDASARIREVLPADIGALARRICDEPAVFSNGKIARLEASRLRVGTFAFTGNEC